MCLIDFPSFSFSSPTTTTTSTIFNLNCRPKQSAFCFEKLFNLPLSLAPADCLLRFEKWLSTALHTANQSHTHELLATSRHTENVKINENVHRLKRNANFPSTSQPHCTYHNFSSFFDKILSHLKHPFTRARLCWNYIINARVIYSV